MLSSRASSERHKDTHRHTKHSGTAHSRADLSSKLHTLHAVLCSGLRIAQTVMARGRAERPLDARPMTNRGQVGVCTERDRDAVEAHVLARLPRGRARVELLPCGAAPGYLPFDLLRLVQKVVKRRATVGRVPGADDAHWLDDLPLEYVLYDESDQTLHFESPAAVENCFAVLHRDARAVLMPQRYEKRWGAKPELVNRTDLARAMNKCPDRLVKVVVGGVKLGP